jgi:hypothetical protein
MKQVSWALLGFEKFGRATKRSVFLAEMDRVALWSVLYASEAMRQFVGIGLGMERAPDETTICKSSGIC